MSIDVGSATPRQDTPRTPEPSGNGGPPPPAQRQPAARQFGRGTQWWLLAAALGSFMALATALVALTMAGASEGDPAVDGGTAASATGGAAGAPQTVEVELGDLYVEPSSIEVPAGTELTLEITNAGQMSHDLKLDGTTGSGMLDPGATETVELGVIDAPAQAWCTVPGHKEAGMVLDIQVTGAQPAGASAAIQGDPGEEGSATIDFEAEPGDGWSAYDPTLKPAPGGVEHEITMHAVETEMEVAPGVTQTVWTFDGTVPGTILRGKVGDLFTIEIVNDGGIDHSIDFHASKVAWNDEMRSIPPGESLTYQFEAKHAGAFMYHCGTPPVIHHIGNGMFGAIIIDPPDLPEVDHEFVFVQSEWYLGPEGEVGDMDKMVNDDWDAVVFNGYVNQYQHEPIRVEPDERIRAWVVDAGPSENSAFHVIGTIFDTVYREGAYQLRPDDGKGGSQALDLQPSQGGFVEFSFDEAGLYPFVTHKFSNAGKGALGVFQAGEVDTGEGAAH